MTEDERPLEAWRDCWRRGFAPQISDAGLEALRRSLRADDSRWIQTGTTTPPPLQCCQDWPVEAGCAVALAGWQGDALSTVIEVEEYFGAMCFGADQRLGDPAACRFFLNWHDETPRDEVRGQLLGEVEAELARRREVARV